MCCANAVRAGGLFDISLSILDHQKIELLFAFTGSDLHNGIRMKRIRAKDLSVNLDYYLVTTRTQKIKSKSQADYDRQQHSYENNIVSQFSSTAFDGGGS